MPVVLAAGKKKWVAEHKPQVIRGLPLQPPAAVAARYYLAMSLMIRSMAKQTHRELLALFREPHAEAYFAQDATISSQARILLNDLAQRFESIFNLAAKPIATRFMQGVSKSSAASLKISLQKLSGGLTLKTDILNGDIKDVWSASITENVGLIKSIPQEYFTQVQGAVMRSISTGNGLQDLIPFLRERTGITERRARFIAEDQTRKAFSNLNFARMDKVGIEEYEWLHSAGAQQPRKLHVDMSGNVYRLDQPPIIDEKTGQRGKPGDLINCRCRMVPIIKFKED